MERRILSEQDIEINNNNANNWREQVRERVSNDNSGVILNGDSLARAQEILDSQNKSDEISMDELASAIRILDVYSLLPTNYQERVNGESSILIDYVGNMQEITHETPQTEENQ